MTKRARRAARLRIPVIVTPEYLRALEWRDFGGWLSEEEIPLAKKFGVYKWDGWMKQKRATMAKIHSENSDGPES